MHPPIVYLNKYKYSKWQLIFSLHGKSKEENLNNSPWSHKTLNESTNESADSRRETVAPLILTKDTISVFKVTEKI